MEFAAFHNAELNDFRKGIDDDDNTKINNNNYYYYKNNNRHINMLKMF